MYKFNKKYLLNLTKINNFPLLPECNKGEGHRARIKRIKERIILKKIKDINGMEITHGITRKKN